MKKKLAYALVACLAVAGIAWWLLGKGPITKGTYDRVQIGMSENEVVAMIPIQHRAPGKGIQRPMVIARAVAEDGRAHFANDGVYVKESEDETSLFFDRISKQLVGKVKFWDTQEYSLVVVFDPDGKVMGKTLYEMVPSEEGWFSRLIRRLRS